MENGKGHGKIERSPAPCLFMPVVQYEIGSAAHANGQNSGQNNVQNNGQTNGQKLKETQAQSLQFLHQCQQQAIASNQPKIASLSFLVAPIAPWDALAKLGSAQARHFYYDSPRKSALQQAYSHQAAAQTAAVRNRSMVGVGTVVECRSEGDARFDQAQSFIDFWQSHFCIAEVIGPPAQIDKATQPLTRGHFFCSATFFADAEQAGYFEPTYVFVPAVQVSTRLHRSVVAFNRLITPESNADAVVAEIYGQLEQLLAANHQAAESVGAAVQPTERCQFTKDVDGFEQTVRSVLSQMRSHAAHKVVLADVADVVMPNNVDVVRSLQTLHQNHPDCTVFSVGNGKGQSFIGASPECLLRISAGELTTEALAGTAPRSQDSGLDTQLGQSLLSSRKERYEHTVVVEFILDQLRSLGLSPHYSQNPKLLKLLNLQHLHTPISAALKETVQPLKILAKLHPTPAVAGVPRQLACQFIRQYETFDRGLYTAPIGWIDTEGNSEFIVGIRSALIDGRKARLYAGAGIVSGSEPKKELAEIRLKLQALLNALVCG